VLGDPKVVFRYCTHAKDVSAASAVARLSSEMRGNVEDTINTYAQRGLHTTGLLYRDFRSTIWPPGSLIFHEENPGEAVFGDMLDEMIWIGVIAMNYPIHEGVSEYVAECRNSGISICMVTDENIVTAEAIARKCGILTDGVAMEASQLRQLSEAEIEQEIPRLQVLARSTVIEKQILVQKFQDREGIVVVTGSGSNDGLAHTTADVSVSMGISGTEVAKEASSVILMDNNFGSLVKALAHGRVLHRSVDSCLQVRHIAGNITFLSGY
jgi:Ca2+-transporting ATPase